MSVELYKTKKDCCGCGACASICPKSAIKMLADEYGFVYPVIDNNLCIECGACKKVCGYQEYSDWFNVENVYAAARKDTIKLKQSASGGVFAELAEAYVKRGGVVYGCSLQYESDTLNPKHVRLNQEKDLSKVLGSKYVQSDLVNIFESVKRDLQVGYDVLFSGTPCQVASLKKYTRNIHQGNLLTVDIICHGVPSAQLFQSFLTSYEKQLGGKIQEFYFRDKSQGQGMITRAVYVAKNGQCKEAIKSGGLLSYLYFFLKSHTYRENCYSCPFARSERVGDITLGDFWGFHEEHPKNQNEGLTNSRGVSCILINSEKGVKAVEEIEENMELLQSEFSKVATHNEQLHTPSHKSTIRRELLEQYKLYGYSAVEEYYLKGFFKDRLKYMIYDFIPKDIKRNIKKLIGLLHSK